MCVCVRVYTRRHTYLHTYIHTYIHTHTHTHTHVTRNCQQHVHTSHLGLGGIGLEEDVADIAVHDVGDGLLAHLSNRRVVVLGVL